MKGLERIVVLSMIIMFVVLILVAIWLGVPLAFGKWGTTEISFERACYFWSLTYYRGSIAENPNTGEKLDMSSYCAKRLGIIAMPIDSKEGVPEWDKCRECCSRGVCPVG